MPISGTDDMGAYLDTGEGVLATQRPSTRVDIHSVVTNLSVVEQDSGTSKVNPPKLAPPERSPTQRR